MTTPDPDELADRAHALAGVLRHAPRHRLLHLSLLLERLELIAHDHAHDHREADR